MIDRRRFGGTRCVVTGGLGFIGSNLAHRLAAEHVLHAHLAHLAHQVHPAGEQLEGLANGVIELQREGDGEGYSINLPVPGGTGPVTGASYTDLHARMPMLWAQVGAAVVGRPANERLAFLPELLGHHEAAFELGGIDDPALRATVARSVDVKLIEEGLIRDEGRPVDTDLPSGAGGGDGAEIRLGTVSGDELLQLMQRTTLTPDEKIRVLRTYEVAAAQAVHQPEADHGLAAAHEGPLRDRVRLAAGDPVSDQAAERRERLERGVEDLAARHLEHNVDGVAEVRLHEPLGQPLGRAVDRLHPHVRADEPHDLSQPQLVDESAQARDLDVSRRTAGAADHEERREERLRRRVGRRSR